MSHSPGRRSLLLMTAAAAAGAAPGVRAQAPGAGFGAPVVELYVPPNVLTLEQKAAVVKGFTDVIFGALKVRPDPASRLFVTIIEAAEGGFGVDGRVFAPRGK